MRGVRLTGKSHREMKVFKSASVACLCLLLTACASLGPPFSPVTELRAEQALVYIYRPSHGGFLDGDSGPTIKVDGTKTVFLQGGGYAPVWLAPGSHEVVAPFDYSPFGGWKLPTAKITVDVEAGGVYYLSFGSHIDSMAVIGSAVAMSGGATFALVQPEVALEQLAKLRRVQDKDLYVR